MRVLAWVGGITLTVVVLITAWIVVPIVTGSSAGSSGQELDVAGYPSSVSATGDDGRTRTLAAVFAEGDSADFSALGAGDRLIVSGSGFDPSKGIYVAVCKVPDSVGGKPGPCLGGVPSTEEDGDSTVGAVEYAASTGLMTTGHGAFLVRAVSMTAAQGHLLPTSKSRPAPMRTWTAQRSGAVSTRAMITQRSKTVFRTSTCRCLSPSSPGPGTL